MHEVTVFLSEDFRTTCLGYPRNVAGVLYVPAAQFDVDADRLEALEVAFAVCNSYPQELHGAADQHLNVVKMYRLKHRSLSVGDFVVVRKIGRVNVRGGYSCDSFGWSLQPVSNWPDAARLFLSRV